MKSITKTIKPNMLIDKRDKLTNEISRYWKIKDRTCSLHLEAKDSILQQTT